MKTLNTLQDYLDFFKTNGISHDVKQKEKFQAVLDFQDLIGHASYVDLREQYTDLNQEYRKLFIWAVCSTVGYETSIEVIKQTTVELTVRKAAEKLEAYFDEKESDLHNREQTFEACKKPIYKKIRDLKSKINQLNGVVTLQHRFELGLRDKISELQEELKEVKERSFDYRNEAMKYRMIKEALL